MDPQQKGRSDANTQTDTRIQGCAPRLSKVNLFTLLSLWMELFPSEEEEEEDTAGHNPTVRVRACGAVVVRDGRVLGLHRSGAELHAGQAVVITHGTSLSGCHLFFSRRPCCTCLKMMINAGVSQVAFWPGDPEVSLLRSAAYTSQNAAAAAAGDDSISQNAAASGDDDEDSISQNASAAAGAGGDDDEDSISQEALLDAVAAERLKSNSRPRLCVVLRPLAAGLPQFMEATSRGSDFMERLRDDEPGTDAAELFFRQRRSHLEEFSGRFLVVSEVAHGAVLSAMRLETFCAEPVFSSLRHNMRELLGVLASVAAGVPLTGVPLTGSGVAGVPLMGSGVAGVPLLQHGFYESEPRSSAETAPPTPHGSSLTPPHGGVSQEVARHCIIQARLLSYRTEDPKVGVGAVIWTPGPAALCSGTGGLSLLGCGFNAYPAGSQYAEYPTMDDKQPDRQRRKYRFMIHAEQNALTFRSREVGRGEPTLMFVTKCPCDECVPLILGAGVTHLYTTDLDSGKDKGDISYRRFSGLQGVRKFIWQKPLSSYLGVANGCVRKHGRQSEEEEPSCSKKRCSRDRALWDTKEEALFP